MGRGNLMIGTRQRQAEREDTRKWSALSALLLR